MYVLFAVGELHILYICSTFCKQAHSDVVDLRQHLDSRQQSSSSSIQQQRDAATIDAVQRALTATTSALARQHARRRVISEATTAAPTISTITVSTTATSGTLTAPATFRSLAHVRIPRRQPPRASVDLDADEPQIVGIQPPSPVTMARRLDDIRRARIAARHTLQYRTPSLDRAQSSSTSTVPPPQRSMSVDRPTITNAPAPEAPISQADNDDDDDDDIEIFDPDVQVDCEDDTGETRHHPSGSS